jgi:hypothetical protein
MSDYGPQVKLARLYEKTAKTGNQYFVGRLGMAKVAVLKTKEVAEDGSPMWDVLLSEAPTKSDTRSAGGAVKSATVGDDQRRDDARSSLNDPIPF